MATETIYLRHIFLVAVCAISLAACATQKLPSPQVTGSALALPAVGTIVPVFVFITGDVLPSIQREELSGVQLDGREFHTLSADEAAEGAGGADKLLAGLSDESEIAHVAKRAGSAFFTVGRPTGGGDAAAEAVSMALGLVAAVGVATYLSVSSHARQIGMLEDVEFPLGGPFTGSVKGYKGYLFLPAGTYQTIRIPVTYPQRPDVGFFTWGEYVPQTVGLHVVSGALSSPGQQPVPIDSPRVEGARR